MVRIITADKQDVRVRMLRSHQSGEVKPVEGLHPEIGHQNIRRASRAANQLESPEPIGSTLHEVTGLRESALHEPQQDGLIVDDQNHRGGFRLRGCHRADSVGMGSKNLRPGAAVG
jgi:hypothetical protein